MSEKILLDSELLSFLAEGVEVLDKRIPNCLSYLMEENTYTFPPQPAEKFACPVCGAENHAIFKPQNKNSVSCTNCKTKIARSLYHIKLYNMQCYGENERYVQLILKKQGETLFFMAALCVYCFKDNQHIGEKITHILFCGKAGYSIKNGGEPIIYVNRSKAKIKRLINQGTKNAAGSSWSDEILNGGIDIFIKNAKMLKNEEQNALKDAIFLKGNASWERTIIGHAFDINDFLPAAYPDEYEKRAKEELLKHKISEQVSAMINYPEPSEGIMGYAKVMMFTYRTSFRQNVSQQHENMKQEGILGIQRTCPKCGKREIINIPTIEGTPALLQAVLETGDTPVDVFVQNNFFEQFSRQCSNCGFHQNSQKIGHKMLAERAPQMAQPSICVGDTIDAVDEELALKQHLVTATVERTTLPNSAILIRFFHSMIQEKSSNNREFKTDERIRVFVSNEGFFVFHNLQRNSATWDCIYSHCNDRQWKEAVPCNTPSSMPQRIAAKNLIEKYPIYLLQPESQKLLDEMYYRFGYPSGIFLQKVDQECSYAIGPALSMDAPFNQSVILHNYRFAKEIIKADLRHIASELFINTKPENRDVYEAAMAILKSNAKISIDKLLRVHPDTVKIAAEHKLSFEEMLIYDELSRSGTIRYCDFMYAVKNRICKKVLDIVSETKMSPTECIEGIRMQTGVGIKKANSICDEWLTNLTTEKGSDPKRAAFTAFSHLAGGAVLVNRTIRSYVDTKKLPANMFEFQNEEFEIEPILKESIEREIVLPDNMEILRNIANQFHEKTFYNFHYFLAKIKAKKTGNHVATIMIGAATNTFSIRPEFFIWKKGGNSEGCSNALTEFFHRWSQKAEVTLKLP